MLKTIALAAIAVSTLVTATVSVQTQASAGTISCRAAGQNGPNERYCWNQQMLKNRQLFRQQQEMAAERRAYQKMNEERQRSAPTTEHCYMKNGQLDCKPAP